jgi:hypothetical protein
MIAAANTAEMGDTKMDSLDRMNDATNQDAFWDDMTQGDLQTDDRVKTVAAKKTAKKKVPCEQTAAGCSGLGTAADAGADQYGQDMSAVDRIQKGIADASQRAGQALQKGVKETKTILILVAVAAFFVSRATK